ncbi:hypothetical protein LSTR_LSTR010274 [Laodelphax striatellus]|uniref:Uncharacterized protein n=1 Tax=Laodelphax striatellus TaxID=195883 RepID=A0A482XTU9_LAOST|nr:hypothetical protein LSTR_LSTR010274 [Laodelphax striatellus]
MGKRGGRARVTDRDWRRGLVLEARVHDGLKSRIVRNVGMNVWRHHTNARPPASARLQMSKMRFPPPHLGGSALF